MLSWWFHPGETGNASEWNFSVIALEVSLDASVNCNCKNLLYFIFFTCAKIKVFKPNFIQKIFSKWTLITLNLNKNWILGAHRTDFMGQRPVQLHRDPIIRSPALDLILWCLESLSDFFFLANNPAFLFFTGPWKVMQKTLGLCIKAFVLFYV